MSTADTLPIQGDESAKAALAPLYASCVSFLIINTVFIVLRFFTVLFLRSKRLRLTWDDWFLIPAYVCTVGIIVDGLALYHWETTGATNYTGHEEIPLSQLWRYGHILKAIFALLQLILPAYAFTRYSILALYLRVFENKTVRMATYFFIGFITCQWIAYSMAAVFQCSPVAYYWDKINLTGKCININKFNRSFTPANISADTLIILLPLPSIWTLNASRLRKAGYTFILGMGVFALASSIVRAVTLQQHDTTLIKPDVTNIVVEWLVIEPSLYFITACLPTMHPLFRLCAPASLRRLAESKVAAARQRNSPNLQSTSPRTAPFVRLDSDSSFPNGVRPVGKPAAILGAAGGVPPSAIEGTADGAAATLRVEELGERDGAVPLRDLRAVETGERVLVQTEIITTQEERIEKMLGF